MPDVSILKNQVIAEVDDARSNLRAVAQDWRGLTTTVSDSSAGMRQFALAGNSIKLDTLSSKIQMQTQQLGIYAQRMNETTAKHGAESVAARNSALAYDALTVKIHQNQQALALQQAKLQAQAAALAAVPPKVYEMSRAEQQALASTNALSKGISDLNQVASSSSSSIGALGQIAIGGLREIGSEVVEHIGGAVSAVISIGTNYQTSMALLQTSSSATAAQMEAVDNVAKELGADLNLPATSASGAATAMLELNKAGLDLADSMGAARGTLELAAAGALSEAEAAATAAATLNTFNMEGEEMGRVADQLAAGANVSSASVRDLSAGVAQAGFAFAATGQETDDLITAVAALTNVGLSGSDGATALKNAMMRLMDPTKEAKAAMAELGFTAYDAQGRMKPFEQIIGDLGQALAGSTPQFRDQALSTIFLSDGMKAMIPMLELGASGFAELKTRVNEQGAAGKMAAAQMTGLGGAMAGLRSQLETVALNGIEPLLPLMESAVRTGAEWAGWLSERIGPAMTKVAEGLTKVAGGVRATFGLIDTYGLPVLAAATAAVVGYTIAVSGGLYNALFAGATAIGTFVGAVELSTASALAATKAFMAMAAPIALMAVSVGAIVMVVKNYSESVDNAIENTKLLSKGYQDATRATVAYNEAMATSSNVANRQKAELMMQEFHLRRLQTAYDELAHEIFEGNKFGTVTQDQIDELNRLGGEMQIQSSIVQGLSSEIKDLDGANRQNEDAMRLSREGIVNFGAAANEGVSGATAMRQAIGELTESEKEAEKTLEKLASSGPQAFGAMTDASITFRQTFEKNQADHLARIEELRKTGTQKEIEIEQGKHATMQADAANAYATSIAQTQEYLGRQIMEYAKAQATLNPALRENLDGVLRTIGDTYGIVLSDAELGWGKILDATDAGLRGQIDSGHELKGVYTSIGDAAVDYRGKLDQTQGEYVATLTQKFLAGGYGSDPEAAMDAYLADVEKARQTVTTTISIDASKAQIGAQAAAGYIAEVPASRTTDLYINANDIDAVTGRSSAAIAAIPTEHNTNLGVEAAAAEAAIMRTDGAIKAVPEQHLTTFYVNGDPAIGEAQRVGAQMAAGVAQGILANQAAVMGAMAATARNAFSAAKQAAGIQSPSKVAADTIGAPIAEGVAVGITAKKKTISDALGGALKSSLSGDIGTAMLDTISKVTEVVGKAVESLNKVNGFKAPAREALESFSFTLRDLVVDFGHRAMESAQFLNQTTADFTELAGRAVDVLGKGVDAFKTLDGFIAPTRESLLSFSYALRDNVADMWHRAQEVSYLLYDKTAVTFLDIASKSVDVLGKGVAAFKALDGFVAPSRESLLAFSLGIRDLVADFWHRAQEVNYTLNDQAVPVFAEMASKAVAVIGPGVAGFKALEDLVVPTQETFALFSLGLRDLVREFIARSQEINLDLLDGANQFAESSGKAVGVIGNAVEGFTKLADYRGVPANAFTTLGQDLKIAIQMMMQMAAELDKDGVQAAAALGESVSKVIAPIGSAVDAFTKLEEYKGVASGQMRMIFNDMQQATQLMIQIAAAADKDGVKAAAAFSTSIKTVFDGLKSGIDALDAVRNFEDVPPERMHAVLSNFNAALGMIAQLAQGAAQAREHGAAWRAAIGSFANDVRAGIGDLSSLNGLSVSVQASVSASGGTGAPAGGGELPAGGGAAPAPAPVQSAPPSFGGFSGMSSMAVSPSSATPLPARKSGGSGAAEKTVVIVERDTIIVQEGAIQITAASREDAEYIADVVLATLARRSRS